MSDATPVPEVVRSETVYSGRLFDVAHATIRLPDGSEVVRASVEHPGAVSIVALDGQGRWLLVRQYRYPARRELLEIPAGTREPGEAPEVTAARELREETGFAAASLEHLGGAWMAPGFCSEYMDFYLGRSLRPDPLPQDRDEYISAPVAISERELDAAIAEGRIADGKTIVALALFRLHEGRGPAGP